MSEDGPCHGRSFSTPKLSAYVHVAPWALLAQTRAAMGDPRASPRDPRTTMHTPSISYGELAYTIDSVAQVFSMAFTSQVTAFGWDSKEWMELSKSVKTGLRSAMTHILGAENQVENRRR